MFQSLILYSCALVRRCTMYLNQTHHVLSSSFRYSPTLSVDVCSTNDVHMYMYYIIQIYSYSRGYHTCYILFSEKHPPNIVIVSHHHPDHCKITCPMPTSCFRRIRQKQSQELAKDGAFRPKPSPQPGPGWGIPSTSGTAIIGAAGPSSSCCARGSV